MNTTGLSVLAHRLSRAVLWLSLAMPPLAAQTNSEPAPGDYRVEGGTVDRSTYSGWRLFHAACQTCHGVDATGTDLAPNLVERVKTLTPRAFATKVLTSYRFVLQGDDANSEERTDAREAMIKEALRRQPAAAGEVLMPAWAADPTVNPKVLDLFAYLLARADGKLGLGEPRPQLD